MIRRLLLALAVTATAGLGVAATSTHVDAASATASVQCSLSGTFTFSPGMTTTPQAETITTKGAKATPCHSSDSTISSGTVAMHFLAPNTSCISGSGSGLITIVWNNKKVSKIKATFTSNGPSIQFSGKVTRGEFRGRSLTGAAEVSVNPASCNTGLTSAPFNAGFQLA